MEQCPYNQARVSALKAYLELADLDYRKISDKLGCSVQWTHYVLTGTKKMPEKRRMQLLSLGIPEHLLPVSGHCADGQSGPGRTA